MEKFQNFDQHNCDFFFFFFLGGGGDVDFTSCLQNISPFSNRNETKLRNAHLNDKSLENFRF